MCALKVSLAIVVTSLNFTGCKVLNDQLNPKICYTLR